MKNCSNLMVTDFEQLEPEDQIYVALHILAHFDIDFEWLSSTDYLYGEHYERCMDALNAELKERLFNEFMEVVDG